MAKEFVLALDIGTTSAKAVLFDLKGNVVSEAERMIETHYPEPGWVEQDPVQIERCSVKAIRDVMDETQISQDEISGLGISCAMHSLICVDTEGEALSQALLWSDARSAKQAEGLKGTGIYERTGMPYHPMSPLAKLIWMQETDFAPYKQATYVMSVKEYVLHKWFGKRVIDYSMAAATGLFNFKTFDWDEEALELAGVTRENLSEIVPPTEVLDGLDAGIAEEMGLPIDLPIVIGAADGQLANLGSGAIASGDVAITVGTSGAIRQMIQGSKVSEQAETFSYAFTRDMSIIGGPTNNGGIVLDWVKNLFEFTGGFAELVGEAEPIDIGAEGLLFHPYINGERAPLWDPAAKGNLFGLSITHKRAHIVRAVLEGIVYNLYHINALLERQAGKTERIYANGGLVQSPLFVQMLADVFGIEVHLSESHHNAAWGAAWTALVALGKVADYESIKDNIPIKAVIKPDVNNHEKYQAVFEKYVKVGESVGAHFG